MTCKDKNSITEKPIKQEAYLNLKKKKHTQNNITRPVLSLEASMKYKPSVR